jgi:hypothetical protein
LLYALPGVRQIYVEGNGITSVGQNHSPNSLLSVNTETGEISVTVLEDGASEGMSIIRDLTTFIEVAATEEDKQKIANLLGDFTGNILAEADNETAFITESISQKDFEEKSAGLDIINRIRMTF